MRRARIILLMLCAGAVVSCAVTASVEPRRVTPEERRQFVDLPRDHLGESRSAVRAVLGEPDWEILEPVANRHYPEHTDQLHTLYYPGLVIRILEATLSPGGDLLISVRMSENRTNVLPPLIGLTTREITSTYGLPSRTDGHAFEYANIEEPQEGEDFVSIRFDKGAVAEVEWNFYVD